MSRMMVRDSNNGAIISSVEAGIKEQICSQLRALSSRAADAGVNDGDLLVALGKDRDLLDPFGIFCGFYGHSMRYLGTTVMALVSILGTLVLVEKAARSAASFGQWLLEKAVALFPQVAPYAGFLTGNSDVARITAESAKRLITGFLPTPIWMAAGPILDELLQNMFVTGPSSGGQGTFVSLPPQTTAPVQAAAPTGGGGQSTAGAIAAAMPGLITELIRNLGTLSDEQIDGLASVNGLDPRTLKGMRDAQH